MATETAVDVVMPQMGVSVSEGTVTKWLKQEGDKVDTEVPSPASGTLTQILVQEGETVDVGTKLAQLGGEAGGQAAAPETATPEAAQEAGAASAAETPQPAKQEEAPAVQEPVPAVQQPSGNGKFVSPVVARIASEHGVDPGQVAGTGRGARGAEEELLHL